MRYTYLVFLHADVLLRLKGHQTHLEVGRVKTLGRQIEDLLKFKRLSLSLDHCFCFFLVKFEIIIGRTFF